MRAYFERYGGVMVYDAGFRLPYYGAENDWLRLEFDHSHRRSRFVGSRGVAEPAALIAAGAERLLVPKQTYTEDGAGRSMTFPRRRSRRCGSSRPSPSPI